ncbi:MAG: hypothetical protein FGM41_02790 [Bacteroidetes bacterium]|nr:hypothetical protein [Bacteroidota bacterium]
MKKYCLMLLAILAFTHLTYGQKSNSYSVSDLFISGGAQLYSVPNYQLSDIQKLAPNSKILSKDLSGYNSNYWGNNYNNEGAAIFSAQLAFKKNKEKVSTTPNPIYRMGISYGSFNTLTDQRYKTTSTPYDTLTSSRTGETFYIDSFYTQGVIASQTRQQLKVEGAVIFQTETQRRLSFYAGVAASVGVSFNAETRISEYEYAYGAGYNTFFYTSNFGMNNTETFANKSSWTAEVGIPLGANLRLGKTTPLLNQFNLFFEIKPSLGFIDVPEVKTLVIPLVQNSLGIRYSL